MGLHKDPHVVQAGPTPEAWKELAFHVSGCFQLSPAQPPTFTHTHTQTHSAKGKGAGPVCNSGGAPRAGSCRTQAVRALRSLRTFGTVSCKWKVDASLLQPGRGYMSTPGPMQARGPAGAGQASPRSLCGPGLRSPGSQVLPRRPGTAIWAKGKLTGPARALREGTVF